MGVEGEGLEGGELGSSWRIRNERTEDMLDVQCFFVGIKDIEVMVLPRGWLRETE